MAGEQGQGGAPAARTQADIEAELAQIAEAERHVEDGSDNGNGNGEKPQLTAAEAEAADFEDQASRKGWVPKDKYTGPADKWVDAKTFVQRGERFTKNLVREVEGLKRQLAEFEGTKKAFVKFHNETIEKKDKELKDAITQLRIQRSAATRDGDDEAAVALEDRIEVLQAERKEIKAIPETQDGAEVDANGQPVAAAAAAVKPNGPNMDDPVIQEWIEDGNGWFTEDASLQAYAIQLGEGLIKEGTTARGRPFLDLVEAKMRENFPRKFRAFDAKKSGGADDSTPPARRSAVEGANSGSSSARAAAVNGKTERDLPPEDLKLMRQFISEGWTTREKFLAGYFSR